MSPVRKRTTFKHSFTTGGSNEVCGPSEEPYLLFGTAIDFLSDMQDIEETSWEHTLVDAWDALEATKATHHKYSDLPIGGHNGLQTAIAASTASTACIDTPLSKGMIEKPRRKQPQISPEEKRFVSEYFSHSPYPTAQEYGVIDYRTGFDEKRVRNWIYNTRSRKPNKCELCSKRASPVK